MKMPRTQTEQPKTILKRDEVGGFGLSDFKIIKGSKRLGYWHKYSKTDQQDKV